MFKGIFVLVSTKNVSGFIDYVLSVAEITFSPQIKTSNIFYSSN
jgi:hypothetical protein